MTTREYAFMMVKYEMPSEIKKIQKDIDEDDIYIDDKDIDGYGIEDDAHVTIAPCLPNDVDLEEIKKLLPPIDYCGAYINNISIFQCKDFDVLKGDVVSHTLRETNKKILSEFESYSEYKDSYKPHLTIAYLKKGTGEKYANAIDLIKLIPLKPTKYWFTWVDENQEKNEKTFTK